MKEVRCKSCNQTLLVSDDNPPMTPYERMDFEKAWDTKVKTSEV